MSKGFTLVECTLAGAIVSLLALALLEGVILCGKLGHENGQLLAAEGYAWDLAWDRLNWRNDRLLVGTVSENIASNECPAICREVSGAQAKRTITVSSVTAPSGTYAYKTIAVEVEWGPTGRRKRLADYGLVIKVAKGSIERGE